jgi:signal transduction histidine kinase
MSPADALTASLFALPTLAWAVVTRQLWLHRRVRPEPSPLFGPAVVATGLITLHGGLHVVEVFLPVGIGGGTAFAALRDATLLAATAVGRHTLRDMQLPESRPRRRWLAMNYGLLAAFALPAIGLLALRGVSTAWQRVGYASLWVGIATMAVLCRQQAVRMARPAVWGPEHAGEVTRPDLYFVGWSGVVALAAALLVGAMAGAGLALTVLEAGLGLAIAAPTIFYGLGFVLPELLLIVVLLFASAAVVLGHAAALATTAAQWHPFIHLAAVLALALVVVPAQPRLRAWLTRLIFGRSVRQQTELLAFLQRLSPELGTRECCRRALAELVRVRRLPGAAIMFRDGEHVVHGMIRLAPLLAVWPRGRAADALPAHSFGTDELRRLAPALRDALMAANVGLGAVPILSPRRRWGHLFMNTGIMRGFFRQEDADAFEAFCGQLALVLDAADLLERAVAVERSLAHAEKLAAIGETAARIAHDIRNPVTAARSLAQQLARDAAGGDREAAAVILDELDRVERQVASLLRFSRREDFRFEPVDLGALARATLEPLRSRLEAAHVRVELDAPEGIVARADGEKMRQVIVNLVENALDALRDTADPRRIVVAVSGDDGVARLRVGDSGPGVTADVLPRLFEPFFSLKPSGTGLGLAIAKRTVDAHGGRITAASAPGTGLRIDIEVPLERAA